MIGRRLLMISYYFPPSGGVAVQRTLKHATHLPATGWTPVVIAPRDAQYRLWDPDLLPAQSIGMEVHRSLSYEPARLRRQVGHAIRWMRGSPTPTTRGDLSHPRGAPSWLNHAWTTAVRLLFFPDDQLLWIPFAVRSALRAHRAQPCDAIYSSSPPVSSHLIAGLVKRRTGLPWIADFRDPWIENSYDKPIPGFQRRLQSRFERWIVRTADRVVFATPGLQRQYAARYPGAATRFTVITNGYDPADLGAGQVGSEAAGRAAETFRLAYTGSVYGDDELPIFMDGLQQALERRTELRDRLRVEFIGWMTDPNMHLVEAMRPRFGAVLETTGFLPRDAALARLGASDAGLLLIADGPGRDVVITGKLFDYIGLDKQVLAMAPPGDARSLLEELDWGVVADPESASVAAALLRLVDTPPSGRRADPEGRYDRRRLAARLGALLDEVVTGPARSPASQRAVTASRRERRGDQRRASVAALMSATCQSTASERDEPGASSLIEPP